MKAEALRDNFILDEFSPDIHNLLWMLYTHDPCTFGHSLRVAELSRKVAEAMELPPDECELIYNASAIHDIGKLNIPSEILRKASGLDDSEWEQIRNHPIYGSELLLQEGLTIPEYLQAVELHHERLDGSGYPFGLSGDKIPLHVQILAVTDSWDAMTEVRSYKEAKGFRQCLTELSGLTAQYNVKVVSTLRQVVKSCGLI